MCCQEYTGCIICVCWYTELRALLIKISCCELIPSEVLCKLTVINNDFLYVHTWRKLETQSAEELWEMIQKKEEKKTVNLEEILNEMKILGSEILGKFSVSMWNFVEFCYFCLLMQVLTVLIRWNIIYIIVDATIDH